MVTNLDIALFNSHRHGVLWLGYIYQRCVTIWYLNRLSFLSLKSKYVESLSLLSKMAQNHAHLDNKG